VNPRESEQHRESFWLDREETMRASMLQKPHQTPDTINKIPPHTHTLLNLSGSNSATCQAISYSIRLIHLFMFFRLCCMKTRRVHVVWKCTAVTNERLSSTSVQKGIQGHKNVLVRGAFLIHVHNVGRWDIIHASEVSKSTRQVSRWWFVHSEEVDSLAWMLLCAFINKVSVFQPL